MGRRRQRPGRSRQTNEVARAWPLLRGLLEVGRRRIDLLELGTAGGLLLYPDRYGYGHDGLEIVRRRGSSETLVDANAG